MEDVFLRSAEGKVALRRAKRKPSGVTAQGMGCTALVVLVRHGVVYVANCGDSRAVLVSGEEAVALRGARTSTFISFNGPFKGLFSLPMA